jgi:hypothetical protein
LSKLAHSNDETMRQIEEQRLTEEAQYSTVWVCQGPPRCDLTGDEAVAAQQNGCTFCKQIRIADDGTELTIQPGNA